MVRWKSRVAPWVFVFLVALAPAQGGQLFGLIGNPGVDIEGFGFFGNIALARSLEILEPQDEKLEVFDEIYIEDALWILSGELKRRGYLYPGITAEVRREGSVLWTGVWDDGEVVPQIPPGLSGDKVVFTIRRGILFYYAEITVEGLPEILNKEPKEFFFPVDRLIVSREDRFYAPGRFSSGQDNILLALRDHGWRRAVIADRSVDYNRETGEVFARVVVEPGPQVYVRELRIEVAPPGPLLAVVGGDEGVGLADATDEDARVYRTLPAERLLTPGWLVREVQQLRNAYYKAGYPEVVIKVRVNRVENGSEVATVDVVLEVEAGEQIRIGDVEYRGTGNTSRKRLDRQAQLESGELLDRSEIERARDRLSRLGIFQSIRVGYEDSEVDGERNVVLETVLKRQTAVSLIFGVGSFDIVRGGFEVLQNNLWGLAHQSRFSAVQSFKGTYVDYTYSIPQIFGEDLDFYFSADYLRRQEISFDREEYGGIAGLQHYFRDINTSAAVQFSYGQVEARNASFQVSPGPEKALVSSVTFKANRNQIDNPVFPTKGWQVFGSAELAFPQLGGEVEFQRFEIGGAWHHPVTESGLIFHAGFKHGVVTSFGPASQNIPVPKRFFMGGENTVRGYRRDQASPVNAQGQQIGAVSYMLWQVEFEQRLTELISVVAFVDTVGNAAQISEYPFNQILMSAGAGISLRTLVGPLRFEYGHNVIKRSGDPNGTFQVALGFPF